VTTWIDALASRSGPLHSAATQFVALYGLESDPPRGVGGLHALSRLISGARLEVDDESGREFVAGAGAYLGLLLLDHLPDGAHVASSGEHRLRLGQHGFFDPFAAVARALDAGDAPRALLEAIRCAEAEAEGSGPTARVVKALCAQLRAHQHVAVLEHFDQRVWLDVDGTRVELDLTRIIAATSGEADAVLRHAVQRLCSSLLQEATPLLCFDDARALLYPRLVGRTFVSSLPGADDLQLTPLAPDVWEALVLRFKARPGASSEDRARFVRRVEVEAWSESGASPRTHALRNLARASDRARFLQHDTPHGPLVVAQSRDGLDAARLLLPGLYDVLASTLGPRFLVSTPHRDTLLAAPLKPGRLVAELQARTAAALRDAPHAISAQLWLVTGPGRLLPYAPQSAGD